jgi:hypothetical protein
VNEDDKEVLIQINITETEMLPNQTLFNYTGNNINKKEPAEVEECGK